MNREERIDFHVCEINHLSHLLNQQTDDEHGGNVDEATDLLFRYEEQLQYLKSLGADFHSTQFMTELLLANRRFLPWLTYQHVMFTRKN